MEYLIIIIAIVLVLVLIFIFCIGMYIFETYKKDINRERRRQLELNWAIFLRQKYAELRGGGGEAEESAV